MSRIRTVKPELFRHEDLFDAELASGLPLRLAFIGLFTVADCEGRFIWKPRTLKLDVLPHDVVDFAAVLDALEHHGFIQSYEVAGAKYGWIPSFTRHQRLQSKEIETGSRLPAYPVHDPLPVAEPAPVEVDARTHPERIQYAPGTLPEAQEGEGNRNRKGKEGNGKEGRVSAPARNTRPLKTSLPADLAITESLQAWATEHGYLEDLQQHLDSFRDKATAKDYRYTDWQAALRNAIRDDWAGLRRPSPNLHRPTSGPGGGRVATHPVASTATTPEGMRFDAILRKLSTGQTIIEGEVCHAEH